MNKRTSRNHEDAETKADIIHSSGIARSAHGHNVGSSSHETYEQRQAREKMRKHISAYRHSGLGSAHGVRQKITPNHPAASVYVSDATSKSARDTAIKLRAARSGNRTSSGTPTAEPESSDASSVADKKRVFTEPKARGFNPYE